MDTIRTLLGLLIKIVFGLIFIFIVWWFVTLLSPSLSLKSFFSWSSSSATSTDDGGWLPAPGSISGLFGKGKVPSENDNVYVPTPAYNSAGTAYNNNVGGSQVDFITYTTEGAKITHSDGTTDTGDKKTSTGPTSPYAQKELYIRNLSIYEKGHVYTGLSFVGEAKNTMFQNGWLTIIIADYTGKVVSTSYAEATTDWSIPGWTRFRAKIDSVLPNNVRCTMVFQSGGEPPRKNSGSTFSTYTYSNSSQQTNTVRVAIPVMCN